MPRIFIYLLLAPLLRSGFSQEDKLSTPEAPALPRHVDTPDDIAPRDWVILAEAKGDLNQDQKSDAVVILTHSDSSPVNPQYQRILVVLLATDKGFELNTVSQTAVRSHHTGGILGDPFQELKIERGTFVITHYAGSRDRWGFSHRYRFQNDGWFLIGRTTLTEDTLSAESFKKDENLITGRVIEISTDENGVRAEKETKVVPGPLIPLSKINAEED